MKNIKNARRRVFYIFHFEKFDFVSACGPTRPRMEKPSSRPKWLEPKWLEPQWLRTDDPGHTAEKSPPIFVDANPGHAAEKSQPDF